MRLVVMLLAVLLLLGSTKSQSKYCQLICQCLRCRVACIQVCMLPTELLNHSTAVFNAYGIRNGKDPKSGGQPPFHDIHVHIHLIS